MTKKLTGLPETIGRYQVLELLGRGGMGRVVLGRDRVLNRDVALKLLPIGLDHEESRRWFQAERQVLSSLSHPGRASTFCMRFRCESMTPFGSPVVPEV